MSSAVTTELIGKFDDYGSVQDAVLELKMAGFRRDHIRLLQSIADLNRKFDDHLAQPEPADPSRTVAPVEQKQDHRVILWSAGITMATVLVVGSLVIASVSLGLAFLIGALTPVVGIAVFIVLNGNLRSQSDGVRSKDKPFTVTVATPDKGKKIAATYILRTCGARTIKVAGRQ